MNKNFMIKNRNTRSRAGDEFVRGTLSKHRKEFGFVVPETDKNGDIFIPPPGMKGAMHGDFVEVRLVSRAETDRAREGVIVKILKRAVTEVVGTFEKSKRFGFVVPEDRRIKDDIFVTKKNFNDAQRGDKVVVEITKYPDRENCAEGRIIEIISRAGEAGGDIKALIRQYNLTQEFPEKVLAEADFAANLVPAEQLTGRRDLRDQVIFTIDGADAKDLDDAVSVAKLDNGNYFLGVHIADVSHYVAEGSALDKEALKRGTSVYLIDQVIPMLPKALSNGICSLNPKVDRLTLSIDMEIDGRGKVLSHEIYESVINSNARMIYDDVSDMLERNDEDLKIQYDEIYPHLVIMNELAGTLRKARQDRGSLDFEFDEAYITLNEFGVPETIVTAERRIANRMIEEFMLIANETIAEHFYWMETTCVNRIHESPSPEKIEEFKRFLRSFNIQLKGSTESIHPKALNEVLGKVEGRPEEHVVNTVMLRSMKKAFYGTECDGHFGLGVKYYCHFTSPIRRYPDLIIHRIIKEAIHGRIDDKRYKSLKKKTDTAAEISSATERQAQELEREVERLKKAEYMSYHIGEVYGGVINGVASFGFFVEIENTIEGMVRLDFIDDDYYDYEPEKYRLMGRRTHRIFALGDKITIKVHSVDILNREINFSIYQEGRKKK